MAKKVPKWSEVKAWAAKSVRPIGDCQGFAGNDFVSKFGSFTNGYYSANTAMAASKALGRFHKGEPPHDDQIYFVWFQFPTYGHIMLFCNGVILGDTSHATNYLNKKRTVGTMPFKAYPTAYLGYSESNGVNTIPQPEEEPVAIKHNLTSAEVKKVAAYLNSPTIHKAAKLSKYTEAETTGENVPKGKTKSNYYLLIQEFFKGNKITGIPTEITYDHEKDLLKLVKSLPTTPPVVVTPPVPALTLTVAQVDALNDAYNTIGDILNK